MAGPARDDLQPGIIQPGARAVLGEVAFFGLDPVLPAESLRQVDAGRIIPKGKPRYKLSAGREGLTDWDIASPLGLDKSGDESQKQAAIAGPLVHFWVTFLASSEIPLIFRGAHFAKIGQPEHGGHGNVLCRSNTAESTLHRQHSSASGVRRSMIRRSTSRSEGIEESVKIGRLGVLIDDDYQGFIGKRGSAGRAGESSHRPL